MKYDVLLLALVVCVRQTQVSCFTLFLVIVLRLAAGSSCLFDRVVSNNSYWLNNM